MPDPAPAAAPRLSPQDMERLSSLFHTLAHHKDTRGPLARMVKHVGSPVAGAFKDIELEDRFAQLEKRFTDREMQQNINAVAAQQARQKNELKKGGRSDQEITDIEGVMSKFGISDYSAGATLYDAAHPKVDPRDAPPDPWNDTGVWEFPTLPGADGKMLDFQAFSKNPSKATRAAAYNVIDEFKRTRLPRSFAHA